MNTPRLFVGPMSKKIVDNVLEYSKLRKTSLGLIPSRRQVESDGGYVNNWQTKQFCDYVRAEYSDVLLVRDHGGPMQGEMPDDGMKSIFCDIKNNFNILHIDPWKTAVNVDDGINKTKKILEKICLADENINFEIGTEASIFSYTPTDLNKIITEVHNFLGSSFNRVKYAVVQSGVEIEGTKNIGVFNPSRLKEMINIIHDFSLLSKEHNGDYLTKEEITERARLGLDSINIAPEFGVMQTRLFLDSVFNEQDFELAYQICEKSKKYLKWVSKATQKNPASNKKLIIEVCGHYNFSKEPFSTKTHMIEELFKASLFSRFDEIMSAWDEFS